MVLSVQNYGRSLQVISRTFSPMPAGSPAVSPVGVSVTPDPTEPRLSSSSLTYQLPNVLSVNDTVQRPKPGTLTYIGVFVSSPPSSQASIQELADVAMLGCNLVYNYSVIDGSNDQIRNYLDRAHQAGVMVIVGLDSLLSPENEALALAKVRLMQGHPAVWGFSIADERPEGPNDVSVWLPIITQRYIKVKQLTTKPVMAIAVGWSSANNGERRKFLQTFRPAVDTLAVDNYPVPYYPGTDAAGILRDMPADRDRWFIVQAFSWSAYPDTATQLGYDLAKARYPTAQEMEQMARQAVAGGATSVIYYSYFDIKNNSKQVDELRLAIKNLTSN